MRLAQRLDKLELIVGRTCQAVVEAPEPERRDEEWADWLGDFLWDKIAWSINECASQFSPRPDGPLRAWREAALLSWDEGHRAYHVGLRPFAMAVWLDWKPGFLRKRREERAFAQIHGEWVWDVLPRFNQVTLDDFKTLPLEEKMAVFMDQGTGHWSKDAPHRRKMKVGGS